MRLPDPLISTPRSRHQYALSLCESKSLSGPGPLPDPSTGDVRKQVIKRARAVPGPSTGDVRKRITKRARAVPWPARSNPVIAARSRKAAGQPHFAPIKKEPRQGGGVVYRSLACVEECRFFCSRDTVLEVRNPALNPARAFFVFV